MLGVRILRLVCRKDTLLESVSVVSSLYPATVEGDYEMSELRRVKMSVDTGMVVVIFISLMYIVLVFGLLFYVKNEWCDLLFKNMTENVACRPRSYNKVLILVGEEEDSFMEYEEENRKHENSQMLNMKNTQM
eukprot:GFUD01040487.1.p1 GENE.GFUD01040487.1~~GFUD01040487.1.p1  ORF type:complete len:133 (-),score=31.44 GFUD01040487.1:99-497(-)